MLRRFSSRKENGWPFGIWYNAVMEKLAPTTGKALPVGNLFVCDCGIPLARRTGVREFEIIKFHRGQRSVVKTEFFDGSFDVACPACGRGFQFVHVTGGMRFVNENGQLEYWEEAMVYFPV